MTGGLIQLAAYGAQDHYLTGNPQISFFKMVYRRYTNFSMESKRVSFEGNTNLLLDKNISYVCKIKRNGDLLTNIYFCFELPAIYSGSNNNKDLEFQWVKNIGTNIIDNVGIFIGGNAIDRHYGEWMNIWNELNLTTDQKISNNEMIGNTPELYDPKNSQGNLDINGNPKYPTVSNNTTIDDIPSIPNRKIYVPLIFWFNRNPGLALPLVALQYHDIEIRMDLRPLPDLYTIIDTNSSSINFGKRIKPIIDNPYNGIENFIKNNNMIKYVQNKPELIIFDINPYLEINYIFLDDEERTRFSNMEHQYLIECTRRITSYGHSGSIVNINMDLQHPVKNLIWVGKRNDIEQRNDWNNYSNWIYETIPPYRIDYYNSIYNYGKIGNNFFYPDPNDNDKNIKYKYLQKNIVINSKLILNGLDRFAKKDNIYFQHVQPLQHFQTSTNKHGINVYTFSLEPNKFQPSGSCNMSRINKISLQFDINEIPKITNGIDINRNYYNYDFNIYIQHYNVLRIMSGTGALEFSN